MKSAVHAWKGGQEVYRRRLEILEPPVASCHYLLPVLRVNGGHISFAAREEAVWLELHQYGPVAFAS